MKTFILTVVMSFGFIVGTRAADGVVDRSAEVAGYLRDIQSGTRGAVTDTALKIVDADLGDEQVADALYKKLTADLPTLKNDDDPDMKYKKAMILAIASTGAPGYAEKLNPICAGIKMSGMNKTNYCYAAVADLDLNRRRNLLVASNRYFQPGDDPRVSRIMCLLNSDDFYFKHLGVHRMNWWKILDVRLTDTIAAQLPQYLNLTENKGEHDADSAIAGYIKMLGYSGNPKYAPDLEAVVHSNARMAIKQRAKKALKDLERVRKQKTA